MDQVAAAFVVQKMMVRIKYRKIRIECRLMALLGRDV